MSQKTPDARQRFDDAMESFYESKNPDSRTLFPFIQGLLYQFRLSRAYEVRDILSVVYARGVKLIESGDEIRNPQAWVKRAALNVIREFRREADKVGYYDLDPQYQPSSIEDDLLSEFVIEDDWKAIEMAFKQLSSKDQTILRLRVINGLSWQVVNSSLVASGEDEQAEGTLRLRGYRALQKLRKIYSEVREKIRMEAEDLSDLDDAISYELSDGAIIKQVSQTILRHLDALPARELGNGTDLDK